MKKAIVVGATSGIGRELALLLAKRNYVVGITGRREEMLHEIKATQPDNFIVAAFDISNTFETTRQLNALSARLTDLDLLIISAGIGEENPYLDFEIEKETIDVNVSGFTEVADWGIHLFENQKFGHLVAITSIAGIKANEDSPAYNASKAFQINYIEALQKKANKLNAPIFVSDIRPGFVKTAMAKTENKFWMATVDKAASQILQAIEQKKSVVYVTKRWFLIAILFRLLPRWIRIRL